MSNHIISGRDSITGKAEPILAKLNSLSVNIDEPLEIKQILNNQVINSGVTYISNAFEFKKRKKILFFGSSNLNNVLFEFEISPEIENPTNYFTTYENININTGSIYSFVNLYTNYFRLKITNNELSSVTINLYASSKN